VKVSIITVVLNGKQTIEDCIKSIRCQKYPNIEHIVIDGGSSDGTLEIIKKYQSNIACLVSEPDRGIYDAMNKGIRLATGDIVGILNCDDMYVDDHVIDDVVAAMLQNGVDTCYGDLQYVKRENTARVVRYWHSDSFSKNKFKYGWMPPHPTFFVKKIVYEKYGFFNTDLAIAADYELMLRFLYRNGVSTVYIPKVLVKMRTQGNSRPGLCNTLRMMREEYRAWKLNGLNPNITTFILKRLAKLRQFLK
jgi:glycosyltransferase